MRIGIIGAGNLGSALGDQLSKRGHEIMFGGGTSAAKAAERIGVAVGDNADAAEFAEAVILAVPFGAIDDALEQAGSLNGKVLWSAVNALKPDFSGLAVGFDTSAAEEVARRAPGARVVGALPPFAQAIASGELGYDNGLVPSVFLCGDEPEAKAIVGRLVGDLGAEPVDAGPLSASRLVEPAMMLIVAIAYAGEPRDVGLRLLERGAAS